MGHASLGWAGGDRGLGRGLWQADGTAGTNSRLPPTVALSGCAGDAPAGDCPGEAHYILIHTLWM